MHQDKILMYGTTYCGDTIRAKKVFEQNQIEYEWINIDRDKDGEKLVKEINKGNRSVPTIIFPDGSILVEPDKDTLNKKFEELGLL
ncbi:MAG: glutaredoxin domain-containing protein [Anaerolineaceae bacterium]|nr:glutaredoxin domain-containing protein [Anaerolineaceae bacterium]